MALYPLLRPLLFSLDPEVAHNFVTAASRRMVRLPALRSLLERVYTVRSSLLETEVFGVRFSNPVGLAAGFDKNGELFDLCAALGFGFIEVGSVSALPARGNPRPRLYRLPEDRALINRMGLNNVGVDVVLQNIRQSHVFGRPGAPKLGVNIVKTNDPSILGEKGIADIVKTFDVMAPVADYITLNVSCPNTEDGKTFEAPDALAALLEAISARKRSSALSTPILIKFSPDTPLSQLEEAVAVAESFSIDGYVLVNTTSSRSGLRTPPRVLETIGRGGLSGPPLRERALERIRAVFRLLQGKKPIIGVGGITDGATAFAFIEAGASLVECYTGLVYEGPGLAATINRALLELMKRRGISGFHGARGCGAQGRMPAATVPRRGGE